MTTRLRSRVMRYTVSESAHYQGGDGFGGRFEMAIEAGEHDIDDDEIAQLEQDLASGALKGKREADAQERLESLRQERAALEHQVEMGNASSKPLEVKTRKRKE